MKIGLVGRGSMIGLLFKVKCEKILFLLALQIYQQKNEK